MTLIEMMIVIVIIALAMGMAIVGLRSVTKTRLKSAGGELVGSIRFLFDLAASTGRAHRLVFDLDGGVYRAEFADKAFLLHRKWGGTTPPEDEEEIEERTRMGPAFNATPMIPGLPMSGALMNSLMGGGIEAAGTPPRLPRPNWMPVENPVSGRPLKPRSLPDGVHIALFYASHLPEAIAEGGQELMGQAEIYFFPMGQAERALIHLRDGETFVTVLVPPLNGKARLVSGKVELPADLERFDAPPEESDE